jgi:membrane protease YdiL (CAAX protease family)
MEPGTHSKSIFGLFNLSQDKALRRNIPVAIILIFVLYLGINAIWGATGSSDTLISGWLRVFGSLPSLITLFGSVLIIFCVYSVLGKKRNMIPFACMLALYFFGVLGSRLLYQIVNPQLNGPVTGYNDLLFFLYNRSFFLIPLLPMSFVYFMTKNKGHWYFYKLGDWNIRTRLFKSGSPHYTWRRIQLLYILFIIIPAFFIFQYTIAFEHILSAKFFFLLPAIIIMAFFNGVAEELIFRGFLLPVFSRFVGVGLGIVFQGILFGMFHWGSSPDLVSGFPMALLLSVIGIIAGKSVVETKGVGWAVFAHMMADFAIFSAIFISV